MISLKGSSMPNIHVMLVFAFCSVLALIVPATSSDAQNIDENPVVVVKTSKGDIEIELFRDKAPVSVENFLSYVREAFYDSTIFHRVIPKFMIQGGGYTANMMQLPTKSPIKNEARNGLKNKRGTVAMARTQEANSATCQFYINLDNNEFLNHKNTTPQGYGYAVFGEVIEGMKVVDAIAKVKTEKAGFYENIPVEPVLIESIRLKEK